MIWIFPLSTFSLALLILIHPDLQSCNKKGLEGGVCSLIFWLRPKRSELPGNIGFMGFQGVKYLFYSVQPIHHKKAFFPSCLPFHLFFSPLINLLSYKQENQNLKQALLLLLLLAGSKLLSIKQEDIRETFFLIHSVQCPGFFFLWILYRFFPLLFVTKWGNEIKNSILNANRPFRLYFVQ